MARRRVAPVLSEMRDALDGIQQAAAGKSFEDFQREWLLRHGVQRGIEILSEASRHLPDEMLATQPDIPWPQVRGIGNLLRHEYHRIADRLIWSVVTDSLPPLRIAVEAMWNALPQGERDR